MGQRPVLVASYSGIDRSDYRISALCVCDLRARFGIMVLNTSWVRRMGLGGTSVWGGSHWSAAGARLV